MATTTTSKKRSAKTKTTKKPAKTAAAKASTKVTKKTVTKAPVKKATSKAKSVSKPAVKAAKVSKSAAVLTTAVLRRWHLISAGVFAILAVVTAFVANASTYEITLAHATKDNLASGSQTVFASAAHVFMDIDIRYLLIATLVASAIFSLLRATRLKAREERNLNGHVVPLRWLDFAVTFGALIGLVALLAGISDLVAVKLLAVVTIFSYFFAWLAEREAANANTQSMLFGMAGGVSTLVTWVYIATAFIGTAVYSDVRYTWYVYAAAGALLLGQVLIAKNQKRASALAKAGKYLAVEHRYIALNLLTKTAVAVILIVGLAN